MRLCHTQSSLSLPEKWANALCLALLGFCLAHTASAAEVVQKAEPGFLPKTTSESRQFIVYHDDPQLRFAMSGAAEKMKKRWLEMMNLRDQWKLPIAIHLSRPQTRTAVGEYADLQIYQTEMGIHFNLNVVVNDSFSGDLFSEKLITALFLEYAYRQKPGLQAGETMVVLPQWLVKGTSAYLRQNNADIPPDLFDSLIRTDQLLTLREFLATTEADINATTTTQKIYSSYAECFVQMLRNQPGGKSGLQFLVREMSDQAVLSPENIFKYFPNLESDTKSLEKWWTINLAKSSTIGNFRMLNTKDSEDRLKEYLKVEIPESDGQHILEYDLDEWRQFHEMPGADIALVVTAEKLAHLSVVCSPLYTPLVNDYVGVIESLVNEKVKKVGGELDATLVKLKEERPIMLAKSQDIQDYMNWFEAAKLPNISGAFDEYLRISRSPLPNYQMRKDRLTTYMNGIEYRLAIDRQHSEERLPPQQTDPVLRQHEKFREFDELESTRPIGSR